MSKILLPLIVLLSTLISLFATPAFASESCTNYNRGYMGWRAEVEIGMYKCGESDSYEPGANTVAQAMPTAVSNWQQCVRIYGEPQCRVFGKGFTSGPRALGRCDYDQGHDYKDHSLGDSRAELSMAAFLDVVPDAWDNTLKNDVCWDTAVRKSYIVVRAVDGAIPLAEMAKPACSDGKDNDGDGLIDMADPGCESSQDDNEWNAKPIPAKADDRWAGILAVIDREAATPCPVTITGYWVLEPRSEGGDGEYHFRYGVDYGFCPKQCRTGDVSENLGFQMMSPKGIAQAAMKHSDPIVSAAAYGRLHWGELRTHIEAPERAPGIEYVDGNGDTDATMWFGRAANVTDRGDLIVIDFKSVCQDVIEAEIVQEYTGIDFVVAGSGTFQGSVLGDGVSLSTHPWGTVAGEVGVEVGGPKAAFLGTIGFGGSFDDNCNMPAAWMPQLRLGATFNRAERVGMMLDIRVQYTFAPSWAITPDDATTPENERTATSALGSNSLAFPIDIGPRFAFGRGVHNGWIAPTFTAAPKLRWLPDANDQNVRHPTLTGDVGASLTVGWSW